MTDNKSKCGFASMSPEKRSEIARMGGKALPDEKRSFSVNRDLAKAAGAAGGRNSQEKRKTGNGES